MTEIEKLKVQIETLQSLVDRARTSTHDCVEHIIADDLRALCFRFKQLYRQSNTKSEPEKITAHVHEHQ